MKILISDAFDASLPAKLAPFGTVTEDQKEVANADVVLIRSKTKCTKEYIEAAPNLKLIIRGGVGVDNVDLATAKAKGIIVRNTPDAPSIAVAEMAFALMLAVPNRIVDAHNSMKEGKWLKKELKRTELFGKTVGLLGMGKIATEFAKRAAAFGMKVIAYRQSNKPSEYAEIKSLDEVLAQSDYISMHLPFNDGTKNLINKDTIAKMKKGVIIVNTGRGKTVVEADLVEALNSGKVAAYATDVWYSDPPAADCALLKAPNVLMAPHIGASSKENLLRIGETVVELIEAFSKGKLTIADSL